MILKAVFFALFAIIATCLSAYAQPRPTLAVTKMLLIDGKPDVLLSELQGGNLEGQVLQSQVRGATLPTKRIGAIDVDQLVLTFPLMKGLATYEWISQLLKGSTGPKSFSVVVCDSNLNMVENREYSNALPAEFSISDANAVDALNGVVRLVVQAQAVRDGNLGKCPAFPRMREIGWNTANFKFEISGLETRSVRSVRGFKLNFKLSSNDSGDARHRGRKIDGISLSDLVVDFNVSERKSWDSWFQSFVVEGRGSDQDEKTASLILMDRTMKNELGRITFEHVGIFRLAKDYGSAGRDLQSLSAGLYAESVELELK